MRHLPRSHRPHAADLSCHSVDDGILRGLPPRSGPASAAARIKPGPGAREVVLSRTRSRSARPSLPRAQIAQANNGAVEEVAATRSHQAHQLRVPTSARLRHRKSGRGDALPAHCVEPLGNRVSATLYDACGRGCRRLRQAKCSRHAQFTRGCRMDRARHSE